MRRARLAGRESRAQTEPTTALVAVFAVVVALSLYAVTFEEAVPTGERAISETTLERASAEITDGGVADPTALGRARDAAPAGYRLNLSLAVGERRWTVGSVDPANVDGEGAADRASRRLSVRLAPGVVRPGHLRVAVWR
ncbi:DUF7285 family protein [Haloprofundus halobius]|uniref:DUF7285 family protein n=1 Tax=Haloprofundus halobius TaxID=2876194 RepID=UPI001CCA96D5|nr:hypothetical protein [Haloprofundus halobius]